MAFRGGGGRDQANYDRSLVSLFVTKLESGLFRVGFSKVSTQQIRWPTSDCGLEPEFGLISGYRRKCFKTSLAPLASSCYQNPLFEPKPILPVKSQKYLSFKRSNCPIGGSLNARRRMGFNHFLQWFYKGSFPRIS